MKEQDKMIKEAANFILKKTKYKPVIGLILGSGLGAIGDRIENPDYFEYHKIPNFPVSTVEGHAGRLVIGELENKTVIAMQGRFHFYEGYTMNEVTFPVRVMKNLGIKKIIITNAAGAVNKNYNPGDLMIIKDHLNLQGTNALIGKNLDTFGTRFPDMSNAYNNTLINIAKNAASELNMNIEEGVYACMTGPSYETPAEINMLRILGADAVGMSTAPEVPVSVHSGLHVLGISCITNMAAGVLEQPLNHQEVIETSKKVREDFISLMLKIINNL